MLPVADLQRLLRDAVVTGDTTAVSPLLVGGAMPGRRLAIHHRHYSASLSTVITGRFPATGWLIGQPCVEGISRLFVTAHPPTAPCVADYGADFPVFLACQPSVAHLPYLREFAELDWQLGRLAVSADAAPVTTVALAAVAPDVLGSCALTVQAGAHYLHATWPIDELMSLFLADTAPESWTLTDGPVWLEARGSRGALRFARLTPAEYAFRRALSQGQPIAEAATAAWAVDPAFDPGHALASAIASGLVTSVVQPFPGAHS